MRRGIRLPEDDLNEWLDQGTYMDWLYLANAVKLRLARALIDHENHEDEALCEALDNECRKVFGKW